MIRIVVADDEVEIRRLVINNLNKTGKYTVVGEAGNGEEALREIIRKKPDVLLADICMPKMNGLALTAELVQRGIPIRVVIVSGYDDFSYAKKAIAYGVDDYLLKPFLPAELYAVLDKISASIAERQYQSLDKASARQKFLQDLTFDTMDAAHIKDGLVSLGINLTGYYFVFGICRTYGMKATTKTEAEKQWSSVHKWIPLIAESDVHCQGFFLPNGQYALLCSYEGTKMEDFTFHVEHAISFLSRRMEKENDRKLWCGFSTLYTSLTKTALAKEQAEKVWKRYYHFTKYCRFYGEDSVENVKMDNIQEKLQMAIASVTQHLIGADPTVFEGIEVVFKELSALANVDMNSMQLQLTAFLLQASSLMHGAIGGKESQGAYLLDYLQQGDAFGSLYEAHEILCLSVRQYLDAQRMGKRTTSDIIVSVVKKNVDTGYSDPDFDVGKAVAGLDFSESYIRHVFKLREGKSVKDFILQRRMGEAKTMLAESDEKIQNIAIRSGFHDQCYFSRVFADFFHCSPTEFRETSKRNKKPFSP